ncbi:MAG: DUF1071 domain-containing protein [Oscillospiraceae bacterium]|nr:DUF1071 domain-containing protein [Oscillospiraceae bacterium]
MSVFETLNSINVNGHTEEKNGLTYLSWAWAWAEVKKVYPDAEYSILKFNGLPFVYDENTGYMVYTTVTIEGKTHEMWLPVMDGANKAMKATPYTYLTKWGKEKTCEAATMFDVNKTIMRCLVKNLAMFGLGLYIYAGEDLPESEENKPTQQTAPKQDIPPVPQPTDYYCEKCGKPFEDVMQGGQIFTAEYQYNNALQKRGGAYCKSCYEAMKAGH